MSKNQRYIIYMHQGYKIYKDKRYKMYMHHL